jgi:CheY-like chemotaxis protein
VAPDAKILVVDDNAFNRNVFRQLLKRTRIQVVDLGSGMECLERVKQERFDIIFLDHMMPKMDGVETFLNMKEMEHLCKDAPVVMLTANAIKGAKEKYLEYGFDSFLSKPIEPEKLEKLIWEKLPQELLQKAEKPQEDTTQAKNVPELELPEIEGVDWRHAGLFFENSQDLLEAATDYAKSLEHEGRVIEEAYGTLCYGRAQGMTPEALEALDTYRIHIHSMKSSSAMVGNLTLSAIAKCLEAMAKKQDVEGITKHHSLFQEAFKSSKEAFSVLLPQQEEEKESMPIESLLPMLDLMEFHVKELDVDSADDLMQVLDGYSYEEPVQTYMKNLKEAVENIDTESALEAISKIVEWGNNHG